MLPIGFVVIGRNEGARLAACLNSIAKYTPHIVYVDSNSTDGSVELARTMQVQVVELDMQRKFTAARARNAGFNQLIRLFPHLKYVHFVDGDCIVNPDWILYAFDFLERHQQVAVVCGRRRERFPHHSVYNWLCDIEWNTPIGKAKACGGDAMMRIEAFQAVIGYNETLIAGEEPELCIRLRARGYDVWRLDHEMTLHDADMRQFSQWWKRSMRAGFAYAEGSAMHGHAPEYHWKKESRRAWFWGGLVPVSWLVLLAIAPHLSWLIIAFVCLQFLKLTIQNRSLGFRAIHYAFFLMLGKTAEMAGQCKYWWNRLFQLNPSLIEYK